MKIKALQPFSTGDFSMEQYEVKIVEDALGAFLVRKKVAVELKGTNGDILFVTSHMEGREYIVIDCPWKLINEAALVIIQSGVNRKYVYATEYREGVYHVYAVNFEAYGGGGFRETYVCYEENGYPEYAL